MGALAPFMGKMSSTHESGAQREWEGLKRGPPIYWSKRISSRSDLELPHHVSQIRVFWGRETQ